MGRTSGEDARYVDCWLRKNGRDIPNSNVRAVLRTNANKDVIVNQTMMQFNAGDVLNVIMAVEKTGEGLRYRGHQDYRQTANPKHNLLNAQNKRSHRWALGKHSKRY